MVLGSLLLSALAIVRVVFADPSDGCKESDTSRYVASKEFTFQDRNVWMSFPPDYKATKPATLIFAYHDADMTAKEMEKLTKFNNKEMNRNAIVVYPAALNVSCYHQGQCLLTSSLRLLTSFLGALDFRSCQQIYSTGR